MKPMRLFLMLALLCGSFFEARADDSYLRPVLSDSRIKTLVYNENEVYSLQVRFGYQLNIEFGNGESIDTVSVGDLIPWQITPSGRRLFIKPLEEEVHTNMTVVTNRRTYQFDLKSVSEDSRQDVLYVVRFYYPEDVLKRSGFAIPNPIMSAPPAPTNYSYSLTGPESIAPVKVFDDGRSTYFQFRGAAPAIYRVGPDGTDIPVQPRQQDGFLVVDGIAAKYTLRAGSEMVCVYNDAMGRK